jgi:hypothetical protein
MVKKTVIVKVHVDPYWSVPASEKPVYVWDANADADAGGVFVSSFRQYNTAKAAIGAARRFLKKRFSEYQIVVAGE